MVTPKRSPNLRRVKAGHRGLRLWRPPSPAVLGRVWPPPPKLYSRPHSSGIPTLQLPADFQDQWPHTGEPPGAPRTRACLYSLDGRGIPVPVASNMHVPPNWHSKEGSLEKDKRQAESGRIPGNKRRGECMAIQKTQARLVATWLVATCPCVI